MASSTPSQRLAPGLRSLWARWLAGSGRRCRRSPRRCLCPRKPLPVVLHHGAQMTPHPRASAPLHRLSLPLTRHLHWRAPPAAAAVRAPPAAAAVAAGAGTTTCACATARTDLAAAQELVAYLEDSPASLRCFLQLRDSAPGGAIVSELCRALDSSHCRVLFITPGFLRDQWCRYQMLQALSQAPGSEGRTIPLLAAGLARAAYPAELRFMYFVDGRGPDQGFRQVKEAIMRCKFCEEGMGTGKGSASICLGLQETAL
ncbi:hypothetical protein QTO34_012058 [Cnephaeus nilssonii]|uniref:TIR domain-containing protein n=1 Tax=Cnephaeus nilssonii TaxID=3371016 RepID=A0AA40LDA6_CNENI|nr:hypothetical protein QTO34_012058 [Eptesicus nilssonii]